MTEFVQWVIGLGYWPIASFVVGGMIVAGAIQFYLSLYKPMGKVYDELDRRVSEASDKEKMQE